MNCFVDTSAFYALVDTNQASHAIAAETWTGLLAHRGRIVTTSYVLLETLALIQKRSGIKAVSQFQEIAYPALEVVWVDQAAHEAGLLAVLTAGRRDLSLVDCVSFCVMRRLGLTTVLAFDPHFREQGFNCVP